MERRSFLQHSAAYTLVGLGLGIPANNTEKPVKVAVVGSGGRGTDLIRNLSTIERAQIVAVCDDYPPHLERGLKAAGPQAVGFKQFDKMLEEADIEALVIATPLYLHAKMATQAIKKGLAVFCEKTMCYSVEEAQILKKLVKKHGTIFQVGLQRRANAIYRQAKAMVEAGMLGEISAIKCQWHRNNDWRRPVPVPKNDINYGKLERRLNWRLYWEYSQGLMAELGSHQMDVANWLLGKAPTRVMATGGTDFWRDGREVFDNVFCVYEYQMGNSEENGRTVRLTYSSLQNNAYEGASELVMGTKGTLFLSQQKGLFFREKGVDDPGWTSQSGADVITSGKTLKLTNDPWAHRGKPFEIDATASDTHDELVAFLANVQAKDPETICSVEDGYIDTFTALAANIAIKEARVVEMREWG